MPRRVVFILLVAIVVTLAPAVQAQCVPFKATVNVTFSLLTLGPWVGTASVTMSGVTLTADTVTVTVNAPDAKGNIGNAAKGSEFATYKFSATDEFYVLSHFETQHMTSPEGQFYVNESGNVAGGKGIFNGATGNVTSHGPFYLDLPNLQLVADLASNGVVCMAGK